MNNLTKILTTITISLACTSAVNAASFKATNNSATTQVCIAAVEGNKTKLRQTIKENRLRYEYVANEVECNEQHIIKFVAKYGKSPEKINAFLNKYRNKQRVEIIDIAKL